MSILQYPFIQNALLASTVIAIVAAIVGYFIIARGLTFAAHAFSHIGFAGAAGAVLLGVNPLYGLLSFTILAGIIIGGIGKVLAERDITIGAIFTLALALGVMFLFLYSGYAEEAYSILFGTIFGISITSIIVSTFFAILVIIAMIFLFRPLLFSSYNEEIAQARGIPTELLAIVFLVIVAITVSISVQVVGILLIFTLLIGPAATAMRLTNSPYKAIGLAMLLGIMYSWIAILLAALTNLPVSFFIATISFSIYFIVRLRIHNVI